MLDVAAYADAVCHSRNRFLPVQWMQLSSWNQNQYRRLVYGCEWIKTLKRSRRPKKMVPETGFLPYSLWFPVNLLNQDINIVDQSKSWLTANTDSCTYCLSLHSKSKEGDRKSLKPWFRFPNSCKIEAPDLLR